METRINIFGASITWGASDFEFGGWVARLRHHFETENDYDISVYNLGVAGDSTKDLLKRFKIECRARSLDSTIIMFDIGTNDSQYNKKRKRTRVPLARFRKNLIELINQAKKYSDQIVFIGLTKVDESKTMPVSWEPKAFYDNENIAVYNSVIEGVCRENNLPFIPMLDVLSTDDFDDGLHPNSGGHQKMFTIIKDFLVINEII